jgi:hypothetical protein
MNKHPEAATRGLRPERSEVREAGYSERENSGFERASAERRLLNCFSSEIS